MDAKGLEKTYGIRIPVPEYVEYYVETLLRSKEKEGLKKELDAFSAFEKSLGDESEKSYKYKLIEKSVAYLKNIVSDKISTWAAPEKFILETKEFKPEDSKCYISFDVRQANWTVSKYFLGLNFPVWEEYTQTVLDFPEALAYSKPLRQAILGQVVNPKRYDSMQKYLTWKHLNEIQKIDSSLYKVVSVNSEEIILEVEKGDNRILFELGNLNWIVPVKFSMYDVKIRNNFGDTIVVKEFLNENWELKYKAIYGVNGHRFYIHFKTLILEEPLDDRDLLFKLEGKIFRWCGEDFKDFREWDYVKKWVKPLKWGVEDRSVYIDGYKGVLYFVMDITKSDITLFDVREKEEVVLPCKNYHYKDVVANYHYEKIQKFIEK